jgi:hypothetical protein
MESRTALIGTVLFAVGFIAVSPRGALNPGQLTAGHGPLANQCLACHTPFRGAPAAKCIGCHPLDSIGLQRRDTATARPRPAIGGLHSSFARIDCLECHTDHAGVDPRGATHAFSHDALASDVLRPCTTCHEGKRPADSLHVQASTECGTCHTTRAWTPATFKHEALSLGLQQCTGCHEANRPADTLHARARAECGACHETGAWKPTNFRHEALAGDARQRCTDCHEGNRPADALHTQARAECGACHESSAWKPANFRHEALSAAVLQACTSCHEGKRPRDTMHLQGAGECGACHVTRAWTPATFKHDEFFVLDGDHQTRCATCHTQPSNYRLYTCYGCHEHGEARIAAKHREEGISNFSDCVRCHRSASEHEAGGRQEGGEGHEGGDREHD